MTLRVEPLDLPGLFLIAPNRFDDDRGWFSETWNSDAMARAGLDFNFVQDNHSFSIRKGTLRGLHYQKPPHAQDKLVRCTRGAILDVSVDVRVGSPTFRRWRARELSAENNLQLLVPKGFLHGFVTLMDNTEIQYKCSDFYSPDCDGTVRWNSVGVDWQLSGEPILSTKDAEAPVFLEWRSPFVWEGAA